MPSSNMSSSHSVNVISTSTVIPDENSTLGELKLSVSDLPMLSCHYIQKGCLFTSPPPDSLSTTQSFLSLLRDGLSRALTQFPPLAGRLTTDSDGYVYINCNDAGADFIHATAPGIHIRDVISPIHVPEILNRFFPFDMTVSYDGHFKPVLAVQVTELADGVFIGCAVNHAVTDGTSFWNFFNTFADSCRGVTRINRSPDFSRDSVLISPVALKFPDGPPEVSFDADAPLVERIFSFTRESILNLKDRVNNPKPIENNDDNNYTSDNLFEIISKESNDSLIIGGGKTVEIGANKTEISSFQSLCALLWRAVTRARKLPAARTTTFRMAVNCRHRLEPKLDPNYFGNAIQSIPTYASACDVTTRDLRWCAEKLLGNATRHDDRTVRRFVEDWERDPRCFPLGNFDGAMLTMGSSPRFPMYDNDFGWGRPMAVRSGRANKFDGKISAFPGREGGGNVDLEVVLAPETMAGLESDPEFMQYVSV